MTYPDYLHTADAYLRGYSLGAVVSMSLTADQSWSPYVQGTITVPLPADAATLFTDIDPRSYPELFIRLNRYLVDAPTVLVDQVAAVLLIRSYQMNFAADTLTLTVSTGEAKLLDYKLVSTIPYAPAASPLLTLVNYALGKVLEDLHTGMPSNPTITAAAAIWNPGVSAWDYVNGLLSANNMVLWQDFEADKAGEWKVTTIGAARNAGALALAYGEQVKQQSLTVDLERGGWGDAALVEYSWTDAAGAPKKKAYASVPAGSYQRGVVFRYSTPDPGTDPAADYRTRALKRGLTLDVTALSNFAARPGHTATIGTPRGTVTGSLLGCTWTYPADEMSLKFDNVIWS